MMLRALKRMVFVSVLLCGACFLPIVHAQDQTSSFEFALYLLRSGEYEAARVELHRYLYFSPSGQRTQEARFRIGQCHFFLRQWDKALEAFDDCAVQSTDIEWVDDALFWSARTSFRRLEYEIATDKAVAFLDAFPDSPYVDDSRAMI
ncbi:MAG TPA: tetratricopeptide repeat protein, partial [bacterium]|nr:tetratricopeptide repeat protein [bacterium]